MAKSIEEVLKAELGQLTYQCCIQEYQLGVALDQIRALQKDLAERPKPDPLPDPEPAPPEPVPEPIEAADGHP